MSICIVKGNDNAKRIYEKMGAKHYKDFIDYFGDTESNSEKLIWNNLNYFKEIGIKRINDLLIERTDLFLVPTEILKEKLDKFNLNVLSELVNEDFCNLELIDMY